MKSIYRLLFIILFGGTNVCAQNDPISFVPQAFTILDSASGYLNEDLIKDWVLVLKCENEKLNPESLRPVLILIGTSQGNLELFARNDSVVMCSECGGAMGDPYLGLELKANTFSFEFYCGTNERWTRSILFAFDSKTNQCILMKDAGLQFWATDPDKQESYLSNEEDFGKLLFQQFSNAKSW